MRRIIIGLALLGLAFAAAPGARADAAFDGSFYRSIDVARAARDQYGSSAQAVTTCDHLYCWKAKVGTQLKPLDMKAAVSRQYGSSFRLIAVGVYKYDWRAVNFGSLPKSVIPTMLVASDRFFDISGVRTGLNQFQSVNVTINDWYQLRVTKRYKLLQPIVVPTNRTSSQWNAIANSTSDDSTRYALLDDAKADFQAQLPSPSSNLRMILSPFTGASPDVWLGAASSGRYAVVPPRATSITCPASGTQDSRCADATYAIGHELGHTFGLQHSCDAYPSASNCAMSIMQTTKPWDAILLPGEKTTLKNTGFFS